MENKDMAIDILALLDQNEEEEEKEKDDFIEYVQKEVDEILSLLHPYIEQRALTEKITQEYKSIQQSIYFLYAGIVGILVYNIWRDRKMQQKIQQNTLENEEQDRKEYLRERKEYLRRAAYDRI